MGTTSIGWAVVNEAENNNESSSIVKAGVRLVPLSSTEITEFGAGQKISLNAGRRMARAARRNLHRYKLRRAALLDIFISNKLVDANYRYAEQGKNTTHKTLELRAKAATEKLTLEELLQVLLMINKKRGYKSSPKDKYLAENGMAIDSLSLAKELMERNMTPGQWVHDYFLTKGFAKVPSFYPSDLTDEVAKILEEQAKHYPQIFTHDICSAIKEAQGNAVNTIFKTDLKIELAENKGVRSERIKHLYELRSRAASQKIEPEEIALIIKEIKTQINGSSGYLAAISDRSKILMLNNQTVGQYLFEKIKNQPLEPIKGLIFSRQDYISEFDAIWDCQSKFNAALTDELKHEIKDLTIFYQRKLKSQKNRISKCEFEKNRIVVPKSAPLFQLFRIWQNINAIRITNLRNNETIFLGEDDRNHLFQILNQRDKIKHTDFKKIFRLGKDYSINFEVIQGNRTRAAFIDAFLKIAEEEGQSLEKGWEKPDEFENGLKILLQHFNLPADLFDFNFDPTKPNEAENSNFYKLWHILYSAEEDDFVKKWLLQNLSIKEQWLNDFISIPLEVDYGSLSSKAIKRILPYLMDGLIYSDACKHAKYNHSSSLREEENQKRKLLDKLSEIKKNSLRNPVVEKILNQLVNVVNAIIAHPNLGRPDEVRIELARELKANADQRKAMTESIATNTKKAEVIAERIKKEYGQAFVTRNNILRFKLWEECGGISIYTGQPIQANKLFDADYDIDHIIPQSRLFDDSRSNKVLCERALNIEKGNKTAYTFLLEKYGKDSNEFAQFQARVTDMKQSGNIGFTKYKKLLMPDDEIPQDFVERQLKETQYITKKAAELLLQVSRDVVCTTGIITDRLRDDWGLEDLLKQINLSRYESHSEWIEQTQNKDGKVVTKIKNWSKRDDHRHHAMDAITIAFTKRAFVQYLNTLNAREDKNSVTYATENKYLARGNDGKLRFREPMPEMRNACKQVLEQILVSHKSKTKVTTKRTNKIKTKNGLISVSKNQETPRGQLHLESVYKQYKTYATREVKMNAVLTEAEINKVANAMQRTALLKRLQQFNNDSKEAFTGKNAPAKNPVVWNEKTGEALTDKVKLVEFENGYSIRKDVAPGLNVEKVIDAKIKRILQQRLAEFNNNDKLAFTNLKENPIWFNKEKGIAIKSVKITGISNAVSLHEKRDVNGEIVLVSNNKPVPTSWVNTGNNHHIAIYRNEAGELNEVVVSLFEAVARKNMGLPVIEKVHSEYGNLVQSLKANEMFLFSSENFNPFEVDLTNPENYAAIGKHLFRVQKIGSRDYTFRHHCETKVSTDKDIPNLTVKRVQNLPKSLQMKKIKICNLGFIKSAN